MAVVSNPLIFQSADPHIYLHSNGMYYFTATVPTYDRITIRSSRTIQGLSTAEEVTVWNRHESGLMAAHIWAPEMHYINGSWYIYFSAGSSSSPWSIRIFVLESTSFEPCEAKWEETGMLDTGCVAREHLKMFPMRRPKR